MKKYASLLTALALMLSSLACQTASFGGDGGTQPLPSVDGGAPEQEEAPTESTGDDSGITIDADSDFPMLDDASNVVEVAGTLTFQTSSSLEDVMKFYRDYYTSQGYTEREPLTTVSDGTFSFVFDGDPSGKAVVIQGVDLGNGMFNVIINLQDI